MRFCVTLVLLILFHPILGQTVFFNIDGFPKTKILISAKYQVSLQFSQFGKMEKRDSLLFIYDNQGEWNIHVVNINQGRYLKSLIKRGSREGELQIVSSMFTKGEYVFFHDFQIQRLLRYRLDSLLIADDPKSISVKTSFGVSKITRVVPYANYFISEMLPALPKRFMIFNYPKLETISSFGNFPQNEKPTDIAEMKYLVQVLGNLYQGRIAVTVDNSKLVSAHPFVPLIEIFDLNDKAGTTNIVGPNSKFPPDYQITKSGNGVPLDGGQRNYESLRLAKNNIFALYSGKTYTKMEAQYCRYIFQFDLKGNPMCKYELDTEITDFVIDEIRGKIVAVSPLYPGQIIEFELKNF